VSNPARQPWDACLAAKLPRRALGGCAAGRLAALGLTLVTGEDGGAWRKREERQQRRRRWRNGQGVGIFNQPGETVTFFGDVTISGNTPDNYVGTAPCGA
jgi:hypothetical protein